MVAMFFIPEDSFSQKHDREKSVHTSAKEQLMFWKFFNTD